MTEPADRFAGWTRPNKYHPWTRVVGAGSEAEAWQLLLGCAPGGEKCVLPLGQLPGDRSVQAPVHRGSS